MESMKNKITFYTRFNILRNNDKRKLGTIKNKEVKIYDERIIRQILLATKTNAYTKSRTKYSIINGITNDVVALVDSNNRIFDDHGNFIGTVKSKALPMVFIFFILCFVTSVALLASSLIKAGHIYKDLYITEGEGIEIKEKWNIFTQNNASGLIKPDLKGYYRFNLINDNPRAVVCELDFDDINEYNIPMLFKLYTTESDKITKTSWVSLDEIKTSGIVIMPYDNLPIILEWMWYDDGTNNPEDTLVGNIYGATYTIIVKIVATQD